MDYPHGRHHDSNHGRYRRDDDREDDYYDQPPPPPRQHFPPSGYGVEEPPPSNVYHTSHFGGPEPFSDAPPPPQVYHTSHGGGPRYDYDPPPPRPGFGDYDPPPPRPGFGDYDPPPPRPGFGDYDPPPPRPGFGEYNPPPSDHGHHRPHMPHFPSFDHHSNSRKADDLFPDKSSVKVYSKAETNYALTIRDGKVILAPADSSDPSQHWIKDQKYSTKVKDEEGFPSFSLINKATGQALKHAIAATQPVQLTPYDGNSYDESTLWTESRDLGDGYRTIRSVNNIKLNMDAFNGDQNHGGVHDGTSIVLWEWKKGDNQRWKIVSY